MKLKDIILILIISSLLVGCKKDVSATTIQSEQVVVNIISPKSDTTYFATADSILINISVISENQINTVDLFIDSILVHQFTSAPYSFNWSITSITGSSQHFVYAIAHTQAGVAGVSPIVKCSIYDPNPSAFLVFSSPIPDTITATDSIQLVVTGSNNIDTSLIKKVQIFADNVLIREFNSPPYSFYWLFDKLQNNTVHSVYAKSYDWRNRSNQSASKVITVHVTPLFPFAIGNKWYYRDYNFKREWLPDSNNIYSWHLKKDSAFIVRQVIDVTSDGKCTISRKYISKDTTLTKNEYWQYVNGKFYYSEFSWSQPLYISSLSQDSTWATLSWVIKTTNIFGAVYKTQYFTAYTYYTMGYYIQTFGIAEGVGFIYYYSNSSINIVGNTDSAYVAGMQLGGTLIGDSTFTSH